MYFLLTQAANYDIWLPTSDSNNGLGLLEKPIIIHSILQNILIFVLTLSPALPTWYLTFMESNNIKMSEQLL